jgi:tetraacyldisaccharide 4'-kinase
MIQSKGKDVAFLLRGYGRHTTKPMIVDARSHDTALVGDEALLLAEIATTIVARNRADGARLAEREGANIVIMDDG